MESEGGKSRWKVKVEREDKCLVRQKSSAERKRGREGGKSLVDR